MKASTIYKYEKYYFRVFSLLMVLITLIFVFNGGYIGAGISLALGVLLSFSYQGTKIDVENGKYLKYDRFLWITIGKWETLSTPSYVTIVRIKLSNQRNMPAPMVLPEDKKSARAFKVNLVVEGDKRYVPVCRGSLELMTEEALRLGRHLQIRVLDYTTHEKHWIL